MKRQLRLLWAPKRFGHLAIALLVASWVGGALGQEVSPPTPVPASGEDDAKPTRTPIREVQDEGWKVKIYRRDPRRLIPPPTPAPGQGNTAARVPGLPAQEPTMAPTPVPSDPGKTFVAVVDERRLSRAELDRRAAEPLKKMRSLLKTDPSSVEFEEVRVRQEGSIVQDWVNRRLLAEEAKRRMIMLSQGEFDQRYQQLLASPEGKQQYENTMKVLGMTPDEVKAELYDDMLGEKVVDQELKKCNNDAYLKPMYEKAPNFFMRPEQVHVLHYSMTLEGTEVAAELRRMREKLEEVRKRIMKGELPSKIAEEEGGKAMGVAGLDLGWVDPTIQSLPMEVQKAVAKLKPGETSTVIFSKDDKGRPQAFHIVKVVEHRPAVGETYESAKPLMIESLRESVRQTVTSDLKKSGAHRVLVNLSGIPPDRLEGALADHPAAVVPAATPSR